MVKVKEDVLTQIELSLYYSPVKIRTVLVNPKIYREIMLSLNVPENESISDSHRFSFSGLFVDIVPDQSVSFEQKYTLVL